VAYSRKAVDDFFVQDVPQMGEEDLAPLIF